MSTPYSIAVSPFTADLPADCRGEIDVYDVVGNTTVGRQRASHRDAAHLVIGYDLKNPRELAAVIEEAVDRYKKAVTNNLREEERQAKIAEFLEEDEKRANDVYSRECAICFTENPSARAVLIVCGHMMCMACVTKMERNGRLECPFCRRSTAFVKLQEEVAEKVKDETNVDTSTSSSDEKLSACTLSSDANSDCSSTQDSPRDSSTHTPKDGFLIRVTNAPSEMSDRELREMFSEAGRIIEMTRKADPMTGRHDGCAFIRFSTELEAKNAVRWFDGEFRYRRELCVQIVNAFYRNH